MYLMIPFPEAFIKLLKQNKTKQKPKNKKGSSVKIKTAFTVKMRKTLLKFG